MESVSIDKIKDLKNKIELRNKNGGVVSLGAGDGGEYGPLDE